MFQRFFNGTWQRLAIAPLEQEVSSICTASETKTIQAERTTPDLSQTYAPDLKFWLHEDMMDTPEATLGIGKYQFPGEKRRDKTCNSFRTMALYRSDIFPKYVVWWLNFGRVVQNLCVRCSKSWEDIWSLRCGVTGKLKERKKWIIMDGAPYSKWQTEMKISSVKDRDLGLQANEVIADISR